MCMLVGMLLTRTLGRLGKVGSKAVSCGKLVKLSWGKIRQGAVFVVMRLAFGVQNSAKNVQNCAGNAVKALEEMKNE